MEEAAGAATGEPPGRVASDVGAVVAGILTAIIAVPAAQATSQPRDCDSNSIMYCGAYTKSEFAGKLAKGDTMHTAANLQHIYYNEGRGITYDNFMSGNTVDGLVYKNGNVVVNGQVVATGAMSIGRIKNSSSTACGSVWIRPTSSSFAADSIQAWVDMDGNQFHYFVLKACGNAGTATPVVKPTPTPATPTPATPTPATPTPTTPTPTHTPIPSVTPIKTPIPTQTPAVLGASTEAAQLPQTGPESALAGIGGLSAVGYAARAYMRSRRGLVSAMRRK